MNLSPRGLTLSPGHEEKFRVRFLMFLLNQASRASKGVAIYAACSLRSHLEARAEKLLLYHA